MPVKLESVPDEGRVFLMNPFDEERVLALGALGEDDKYVVSPWCPEGNFFMFDLDKENRMFLDTAMLRSPPGMSGI